MNRIKLFLAAALVSGFLSTTVVANVSANSDLSFHDPAVAPPEAITVVAPQSLPRRFLGKTVTVAMTINENGQPTEIELVSPTDRDLARSLIPVLSQWQFAPAHEGGEHVTKRVILPVEFVNG